MTQKDYIVLAEGFGRYLSAFYLNGEDAVECNKKAQYHKDRIESIFYPIFKKDNIKFDPDIFSKYVDKVVDEIVAH